MKLLSFDIELSDVFDIQPGEDMEQYAPFHISVAATAIYEGEERIWHSEDGNGQPALNLSQQRAHELLVYLDQMQQQEYMVCAWNGLSFDLKWIGHQAEDMALAAKIALKSYDPMFQFFNIAGFPVGLAKVAQAMGVEQEKLMKNTTITHCKEYGQLTRRQFLGRGMISAAAVMLGNSMVSIPSWMPRVTRTARS